ncbi:hypothetical protein GCM10011348_11550 [Marinobacterium nitratireducens]|uniref:Lipoprotein n=1 Tax=Marinobacterium nitratireducens TaxID=518897 RepID=A0A917ZA06_9GAMM|nr:hypothetical protein [Marinobacterium nitratireducens]GGO78785.1 hypothetical protein GCM10011348_11550 [Marinobacterium nitratireducens]
MTPGRPAKLAALGVAAAIGLAGCGTPNLKNEDYYTLDTRYLLLCRGTSNHCLELSLVASAITKADPIEEAYGRQIQGPNYPLSLARILLSPADESYRGQPVDGSSRYYTLPVNDKTNIAWDTLDDMHAWLYEDVGN